MTSPQEAISSKCKDCRLECSFKEELLAKNKNQTCVIPVQKAHAEINDHTAITVVDTEVLEAWSTEYLVFLKNLFDTTHDIESKTSVGNFLFNKVTQYKTTFQPAATKHISVEIDLKAQAVAERVQKYLEKQPRGKVIDVERSDKGKD